MATNNFTGTDIRRSPVCVQIEQPCARCGYSGSVNPEVNNGVNTCPECKGTGRELRWIPLSDFARILVEMDFTGALAAEHGTYRP